MGMEVVVEPAAADPLAALAAAGIVCTIMMVDGNLVAPGTPLPATWRDVRLRAAEGTVTLSRRGAGIAVVVFGNADPPLRDLQERIARALAL